MKNIFFYLCVASALLISIQANATQVITCQGSYFFVLEINPNYPDDGNFNFKIEDKDLLYKSATFLNSYETSEGQDAYEYSGIENFKGGLHFHYIQIPTAKMGNSFSGEKFAYRHVYEWQEEKGSISCSSQEE